MEIILLTLTFLLTTVSSTSVLRLNVCSESEAVFTCTVTETTTLLWKVDFLGDHDIERVAYESTNQIGEELQIPNRVTGVIYKFNFTSKSPLTSTLTTNTSTDLLGATVSCFDGFEDSPGVHMDRLALQEPTQPVKTTFEAATRVNDSVSLGYLHWSIANDDGEDTVDLNTSYIVTIIPESVESNQSILTTSNNSIWLTLFNDQEYNISVAARNCVGTGEPVEIHIKRDDSCSIPWATLSPNISFEYSDGSQLVYQCLSGLQPHGEMVSICTGNGTWYPNPADIVCIPTDKDHDDYYTDFDSELDINRQDHHGLNAIVVSTTITLVFLFLVVLSITTTLSVTVRLHRRKHNSRSEIQTVEQSQNEYTEVEHLHQCQDEDSDSAHIELNHNLTEGHSTVTLISEQHNPLFLIQLRVEVTPKWYQFGLAISVPEYLLQQYSSHPADERLIEVLNYWLKSHQNLTWRDVAKILHDIELHELAEGIMNVYESGCLPVEVDADDSDSEDNILLPLPVPSNMRPTTETWF